MADKKKRDKSKSTLSSAQEMSYSRDFKMADQAGGYTRKKARH
ncbi:YfhE family protein [Bacillus timonensis]|nr:YfhE family protein [Bacillus timonensis]